MATTSPTAARVEFAHRIRRRRAELGLSSGEMAKAMGFSRVYLSSIENHRATLSKGKFDLLIQTLELGEDDAGELVELLDEAHHTGWWHKYRDDLAPEMQDLIGIEAAADRIEIYEAKVVTGLLQTKAYASEVVNAAPEVSVTQRATVVEIRMARQERLASTSPPSIDVVLSETTLHQHYGPKSVLVDQLQFLVESAETNDWLTVRVQPFRLTPLGMTGISTAVLFGFATPTMPDGFWAEAIEPIGMSFHNDAVERARTDFQQMLTSCLSPPESVELIRDQIWKLRR